LSKFNEKFQYIVLDTGILVSYLSKESTAINKWLDEKIFNDELDICVICHKINLTELFYIICRKLGVDKTRQIVQTLNDYIYFCSNDEIYEIAGLIKCRYSISLADCFSIATAKFYNCALIFKQEIELNLKLISQIKNEFNTKIWILNEQNGEVEISQ